MSEVDLVVSWTVAAERAELAAEELWGRGATAVELRPQGRRTTLVASFPTAAATRSVADEVEGQVLELSREWADAWRRHAQPVAVGSLVVVPAGRRVITMDPGSCFGSGSHPSTRLLLAHLAERPPSGARVADVGAGSGILAVAAAVLGAASVQAVDIDPASAEIVRNNAARNGVGALVRSTTGSVEALQGPFELTMVNVTAALHAELAPSVTRLAAPGGRIVLAGLLPGQWRHVAGAYAGCELLCEPELDGWVGAELRVS